MNDKFKNKSLINDFGYKCEALNVNTFFTEYHIKFLFDNNRKLNN